MKKKRKRKRKETQTQPTSTRAQLLPLSPGGPLPHPALVQPANTLPPSPLPFGPVPRARTHRSSMPSGPRTSVPHPFPDRQTPLVGAPFRSAQRARLSPVQRRGPARFAVAPARRAPRARTRLTGRARLSAARSHSATVRPGPRVSSFLYLRPQSPPGLSAPPLSRCPAAPLHLRSRLDPPAALPHSFLACAPRTPSDPRRFRIRGRVIPRAQRLCRDFRSPHAEDHPRRLFNAPHTSLNPIPTPIFPRTLAQRRPAVGALPGRPTVSCRRCSAPSA